MNLLPPNAHDPPVLLFFLAFSAAAVLLWLLLRRIRKTPLAHWPFVLGALVATTLASLVYLELFFHE